ncbi:MAG: glycine--tRNA ligase subunit beta [Beggiatoa sp. IS2]|nr:MAG: glycine--tRNA ligase subunit beta [Beggiatoa sp. IS2]
MTEFRNLLIEIGTEELPPKALATLSEAFLQSICQGLKQQQLPFGQATPYATPRRLAVLIEGVAVSQLDQEIERRGPPLSKAFDPQGQPTSAALGFARSCSVDMTALEKLETEKGAWLIYRLTQPGQATTTLLPNIIETALANLPIPKRMRWGNLPFEFVRPVHWLVILLGQEIVETTILGVNSGRETRGHRFHHPLPIVLTHADEYAETLEKQGAVIPLFVTRRQKIADLVAQAATALGGQVVADDTLLNEVTSLVEWPVAVTGQFEEKFLEIPPEALIAVMKGQQRYFPVVNQQNQLIPYFIAISNIESPQPQVVKAGNERVIRPRLSDAAFFWKQDCAQSLESRLPQLRTIVFQNELGSLYEKSKRIAKLSGQIAKLLGEEELQGIRAAQLAKCDLVTNMVSEFPELQGIMGEYYARHDGETPKVAVALREYYSPRFGGDTLPTSTLGQALAIADRLDTVVGIFGIGQAPTGDKDPFGLRRMMIAVLRIMIEQRLPLNLEKLLTEAQAGYPNHVLQEQTSVQVFDFSLERLKSYYQEKGINYDTVDAVLAYRPVSPLDIDDRIRGVENFRQQAEAESLTAANKRIHNILKKTEQTFSGLPDPTYFEHRAERKLYDQLETVTQQITPLLKQGHYQIALQQLATLREPIDDFFDKVMVMDDNLVVRNNRLMFLQAIRNLFLQIADISRLQIG